MGIHGQRLRRRLARLDLPATDVEALRRDAASLWGQPTGSDMHDQYLPLEKRPSRSYTNGVGWFTTENNTGMEVVSAIPARQHGDLRLPPYVNFSHIGGFATPDYIEEQAKAMLEAAAEVREWSKEEKT